MSYQRGKFVKTVVQPSSSLPEHQLQPSSPFVATIMTANIFYIELEQLECLRSEDTPRRLMITHTIESYWIPSQKKTKSKLQI